MMTMGQFNDFVSTALAWLQPLLDERGVGIDLCRLYIEECGPRPMMYVELGHERLVYTDGAWRHLWRVKV